MRLITEDFSDREDEKDAVLIAVKVTSSVERFGVKDLCVTLVSVTLLNLEVRTSVSVVVVLVDLSTIVRDLALEVKSLVAKVAVGIVSLENKLDEVTLRDGNAVL